MLKIVIKALALLKPKLSPKDALLLELLKENKKLMLELKHQKQVLGSEIFRLRDKLYAERLYSRAQIKELNNQVRKVRISKKEIKCGHYIEIQKSSSVKVYV